MKAQGLEWQSTVESERQPNKGGEDQKQEAGELCR